MVKAKVPVGPDTRRQVDGGSASRFLIADCDEWFAVLDALRGRTYLATRGVDNPVSPRRVVFKLR
jgi:hypothetical protein